MSRKDLPPHLRESDRERPAPALELPLELPAELEETPAPPPPDAIADERPVDPFLRRS